MTTIAVKMNSVISLVFVNCRLGDNVSLLGTHVYIPKELYTKPTGFKYQYGEICDQCDVDPSCDGDLASRCSCGSVTTITITCVHEGNEDPFLRVNRELCDYCMTQPSKVSHKCQCGDKYLSLDLVCPDRSLGQQER